MTPRYRGADFFTAVHELLRQYPDRAPIGEDADPATEALRFFSDIALHDQGGEVADVREGADGRPTAVFLRWLSAFGANGGLPLDLTDRVMRAGKDGEPMREFVDAFLHRPLSLAYSASEAVRPGAAYERLRGVDGWSKRDPYLKTALQSAGLFGLPDDVADRLIGVIAPLARYAGTPAALAAAASAHLGVRVRVGRSVVRVGEMDWPTFRRFVPPDTGAEADAPLVDLLVLTRLFAGGRRFDVQLLLKPGEVIPTDDPVARRRWVSALPLDRGDGPRVGGIPAAVCEAF